LERTFGVSIEPTWPVDFAVSFSKLAEKYGLSNVWVPDGGPIPPYSDTIVTLASIASVTSRIKFGSAILNFYTRNPAWIASTFLALSDLGNSLEVNGGVRKTFNQRAILGIGVGSSWNVGKAGIKDRKGVIIQLREAIESIRELFNGKEVTVRTDGFAIEGVLLSKARKKIPIYVGSNSPKSLEMAGEIADGVILTDRIPQDLEESVNSITLGLGNSKRRRKDIDIVDSVVISLNPDRQKAKRAVRATCAYLVCWMKDQKAEAYQIDPRIKNQIAEFIQKGDEQSASKLVDDNMIDLLTVTGTVEDCTNKCRDYLSHDINQIAFCEPFGPEPRESLALLAKKVIPRL
jgi:5,10-methylenetetrahydromethanopterin reductase